MARQWELRSPCNPSKRESMSKPKREIQPIRATPDERQAWKSAAEAEGVTVSDYVRRRIHTAEVGMAPKRRPRPKPRNVDPALVEQVRRLGNNVNQIATWLNRYGVRFGTRSDLIQLKTELARIEDDLDALLDQQRDQNDAY